MNPSNTNDFYQRLEISRDASQEEIKSAYRKLSLKWHPDQNPIERKKECELEFIAISEAYKELSVEGREIFEKNYSGKTPDYSMYSELYEDILKVMNNADPRLGAALRVFMPNSPGMEYVFEQMFKEK